MHYMGSLQEAADTTIGWVWYLLIVLIVAGAITWWIYQQSKKQSQEDKKELEKEKEQEREKREGSKVQATPKQETSREVSEEDLTKIEGIGPKVAKVLRDAGIRNFDSLARADAAEVKSVLNEAGLQMMSPEGWIEQAELAAKGDWDGLQKLQDELKGGRRR